MIATNQTSSNIKFDTTDPERYTQLQTHIQQRIQALQSQIASTTSSTALVALLRAYMALKNIAIEAHTSPNQSKK